MHRRNSRRHRTSLLRRLISNPIAFCLLVGAFLILPSYILPILSKLLANSGSLAVVVVCSIVLVLALTGNWINTPSRTLSSLNDYSKVSTQNNKQQRPLGPSDSEKARWRKIANEAVRRSAHQPNNNADWQLADIGLLVYNDTKKPIICRSSAVPTNATHIRPFVVFDMPYLSNHGTDDIICFKLIDGSGKVCYQSKARYHVKHGQNFITPKTWLSLTNQQLESTWTLPISIGDTPSCAIHQFEWLEVGGEVRAQFNGDGEIDELSQSVAEEITSLDELLADQGDEVPMVMGARNQ